MVGQLIAKTDSGHAQLAIFVGLLLKRSSICGSIPLERYFRTTFMFKAVQSSLERAFRTHFQDNFR